MAPSTCPFGSCGAINGVGSHRYRFRFVRACARSVGVKSTTSSEERTRVCGWLGRDGLCRRRLLSRNVALRNRPFRYRPNWLTGDAIEHVEITLLGRLRHEFARPAVNGGIHEERGRRDIVIPDWMVYKLEVPLAYTGLQIHGNEAFGEQIVSGPVSAVFIESRRFDRQIY